VFVLTTASWDDQGKDVNIALTGYDLSYVYAQTQFQNDYVIAVGASYVGQIQALVQAVLPGTPMSVMLPPAFDGVADNITLSAGTDYWTGITSLAQAIGAECFFDVNGTFILRPVASPIQTTTPYAPLLPVVWSLVQGDGQFFTCKRTFSVEGPAYNSYTIDGESAGTAAPVQATASDTNPQSPTFTSGPYGTVSNSTTVDTVTQTSQAQAIANNELIMTLGQIDHLDITCVNNYALDVEDVINVNRPRIGIGGNYFTETLTVDLGGSTNPMQIGARWGGAPL